MMPLTGEALEGNDGGDEGDQAPLSQMLPLTGPSSDVLDKPTGPEQPDLGSVPEPFLGPGQDIKDLTGGVGSRQGGSLGEGVAPAFGLRDGFGGGVLGDTGPVGQQANPTVFQVRSPVSTYWRGQTYSLYDGEQWLPDRRVPFASVARSRQHRYA